MKTYNLEQITAFYNIPHSLRETAKKFNLSRNTLKNILQKNNICLHSKQTVKFIQSCDRHQYCIKNKIDIELKYQQEINSILNHFGTKQAIQQYWTTNSKYYIAKFVTDKFGVSYYIFKKIINSYFKIRNRTKQESDKLNRLHREATNNRLYGTAYGQSRRYKVNNLFFDSMPEVAFYLYKLNNGSKINRCNKKFTYVWNNKQYCYCPDFICDGELVEIKGPQFVKTDGTWVNPFLKIDDGQFEAKHQCALYNNVKILYKQDYLQFINWYLQNYKKDAFLYKK